MSHPRIQTARLGPCRQRGHVFMADRPRSGSTLLQSLIAANPDVYSPRETDFFHQLLPNRPARNPAPPARAKFNRLFDARPRAAILDALVPANWTASSRLPNVIA